MKFLIRILVENELWYAFTIGYVVASIFGVITVLLLF